MQRTGDIDGQQRADPVIDLLFQLADVATRAVPPDAPATTTDPAPAGPA